jgi:hypothetical protein
MELYLHSKYCILNLTVEEVEYVASQRGGGGGGAGNYHPTPLLSLARAMTAIMISSQACRLVLF